MSYGVGYAPSNYYASAIERCYVSLTVIYKFNRFSCKILLNQVSPLSGMVEILVELNLPDFSGMAAKITRQTGSHELFG
ncbi:hypothetical protein DRP07_05630 [Archaeoglobales archaeon]|nr:MAG: hypothetical protein DRP07_05630 [Archaeoglobales archaeon]